MPDRLLPLEETRARLGGISRVSLWRLHRKGVLRTVKIGARVFWREQDVDAFVEQLGELATTEGKRRRPRRSSAVSR